MENKVYISYFVWAVSISLMLFIAVWFTINGGKESLKEILYILAGIFLTVTFALSIAIYQLI
jgi:hypothetical protein